MLSYIERNVILPASYFASCICKLEVCIEQVYLMGVQEVRLGGRWHEISRRIDFFCGKGNENRELGTGIFVHKRIISAVELVMGCHT
jgi:hypothetical protein